MDQQSLHIGIAARALSHESGGVREYTEALIKELLKLPSPHRFTLYYRDADLLGSHPEASEVFVRAPHKLLWDHVVLPLYLARDRPDVVWFPQNNISLGVTCPTVVSVTDLLYFRIPEFPEREYAWPDTIYGRLAIPRSLRRASRVMTISRHTAYDCQRLMQVPATKMRTIYLAPADRYRHLPAAACAPVRQRLGLERPFFFYAGVLSPRKNIRTLIEAFGKIAHELPHNLVLTGTGGAREVPINDLVERYHIQPRIHRLGKVASDDLVALYSAADAFVYPSLYEGFGIPPLEAMACGCPVVCSNATSLVEVVGDAALCFNPRDPDQIAAHLRTVVNQPDLRQRLIETGYRQVATFSYRRSAQQLLALLEEAALDVL
jgi:glycosyltransferase involved in cell wall biosynthesis